MTDYGTEAWKSYLEVLVKCVAAAQTQVAKLKYINTALYFIQQVYQCKNFLFQKTNSRSKLPTKKRTNEGW